MSVYIQQCGTGRVLYFMEQALPRSALLRLRLVLVQLPVATQYHEKEDLRAEYNGARGERSGKLAYALVLAFLGSPRLCFVCHAVLNMR